MRRKERNAKETFFKRKESASLFSTAQKGLKKYACATTAYLLCICHRLPWPPAGCARPLPLIDHCDLVRWNLIAFFSLSCLIVVPVASRSGGYGCSFHRRPPAAVQPCMGHIVVTHPMQQVRILHVCYCSQTGGGGLAVERSDSGCTCVRMPNMQRYEQKGCILLYV
ncbi:hypothetical protein BJV82DRAFT_228268 [Fennellomyces sp. T-0311]|nr:hypothetical protein BJV82DRAFT_228268 [Fennellomyces sp. T-0311]